MKYPRSFFDQNCKTTTNVLSLFWRDLSSHFYQNWKSPPTFCFYLGDIYPHAFIIIAKLSSTFLYLFGRVLPSDFYHNCETANNLLFLFERDLPSDFYHNCETAPNFLSFFRRIIWIRIICIYVQPNILYFGVKMAELDLALRRRDLTNMRNLYSLYEGINSNELGSSTFLKITFGER